MFKAMFMTHVLIALCLSTSAPLYAAGGKVQEQNPILGDGCVFSVPNGLLDLEECDKVTLPDNSLPEMFVCDTVVVCSETSDNPGKGNQ
jgi:hypothetical protein